MVRVITFASMVFLLALSIQAAGPAKADSSKMGAKVDVAGAKLKPQETCPIQGDPINKKLYVDYKGKRIYVCCEMCLDAVKKDPEKAIATLAARGEGVETIGDMAPKKDASALSGTSSKGPVAGYYTCPMHPEIHQAGPGKCPLCGMTLEFKRQADDTTKTVKPEGGTMRM